MENWKSISGPKDASKEVRKAVAKLGPDRRQPWCQGWGLNHARNRPALQQSGDEPATPNARRVSSDGRRSIRRPASLPPRHLLAVSRYERGGLVQRGNSTLKYGGLLADHEQVPWLVARALQTLFREVEGTSEARGRQGEAAESV